MLFFVVVFLINKNDFVRRFIDRATIDAICMLFFFCFFLLIVIIIDFC